MSVRAAATLLDFASMRSLLMLVLVGCSSTTPPAPSPVEPKQPVKPVAPPPVVEEGPVTLGEIEPAELSFLVPVGIFGFSSSHPYDAAVPSSDEVLTISATGCTPRWTVDGPETARGEGAAFRIKVNKPGAYRVTVTCGKETRTKELDRCDYRDRLNQAAAYYQQSNDFGKVTLDYSGTISGASWTAHNRVSIGTAVLRHSAGCPPVHHYVHEFGHVWEYQHGQPQLVSGAQEQLKNFFVDVYDYGGAAGVRKAVKAKKPIESFNLEQQAEIFADDWYMKDQGRNDQYAQDLATLTAPALVAPPVANRP
jgi:hypothetical protein